MPHLPLYHIYNPCFLVYKRGIYHLCPIFTFLWHICQEQICAKPFFHPVNKGRYTPGDKLQQHVAATDHPMCTGRVTSCSNKVRRHVTATNRFVCTGEFLWKSLSLWQNFVAATSRKKSNQTESVRLVAATKFCCSDKDFYKVLHYTRSDLSLQRVAATCCCNLSPSVYQP